MHLRVLAVNKMEKLQTIILRNELPNDHNHWVRACEDYKEQLDYRIVNLTKNNWMEEIQTQPFDILLAKPGGITAPFKQLYDERIFILGNILGYKIFPSPNEIFIYENKRFLSYWLKANNIPHPETFVFYNKQEALEHYINYSYPVVAKTNIGASGSGVKILRSQKEVVAYTNAAFSGKGVPKRTGPNFSKGGLWKRGIHYVRQPSDILKKLSIYSAIIADVQRDFIIIQQFIPHEFEWRVVRIGDSFFAHKKLKSGEKASGSLLKSYDNPPFKLLSFVKEITDKHKFYSQAVDIFETEGKYFINEMQCIFGQSDPYQMLINGIPGRYRSQNNKWVFEEGDYAKNACYHLRLEYILSKHNSEQCQV